MTGKVTKSYVTMENKVILIKGLTIITTYICHVFNTRNQLKILICTKTTEGPKKYFPSHLLSFSSWTKMDRRRLTRGNARLSWTHILGVSWYETWDALGSSGLYAIMDKTEKRTGVWDFEDYRHFTGSWGDVYLPGPCLDPSYLMLRWGC